MTSIRKINYGFTDYGKITEESAVISSRYRLIYCNFLHQLYLTPKKIHRSKPDLPDYCFRCNIEVGKYLHCTWSCTKIQGFLLDFCETLSEIFQLPLPLDPEFCLKIGESLTKYQRKFLEITLAAARKHITIKSLKNRI